MLGVKKDGTTKTIESTWSMCVSHEEGDKIIFTKDGYQKKFHKKESGWGSFITSRTLQAENNYIVTIQILNWTVINH